MIQQWTYSETSLNKAELGITDSMSDSLTNAIQRNEWINELQDNELSTTVS